MSGLWGSLTGLLFSAKGSSAATVSAEASAAAKAASTALSSKTKALQAAAAAAAKNPSNASAKALLAQATTELASAKAAATAAAANAAAASNLTKPGSTENPLVNITGAVGDLQTKLTATTPKSVTPATSFVTVTTVSITILIICIIWTALGLNSMLPPYLFPKSWRLPWIKPDTSAVLAAKTGAAPDLITEGFQSTPPQAMTPADTKFVNLQPLTIKDTGFKGPYPSGGYDVSTMTANALKSGFRCLTLNIDYMDVTKDGFESPNRPTLIVRDSGGSLLSTNSGSISDVCKIIADLGFNRIVPNSQYPIILYLHVNRAPSAITAPDKYLKFLSAIAVQLQPIAPLHLGLTSLGNFTRQKQEKTLLTTPIQVLEGQVIVLSNADTSMFNSSTSVTPYSPAEDLDFWVNMRVYLDSDTDSLGITKLPPHGVNPAAVIVDLKRVLSMSAVKQEGFAANGMNRYVIAMGDRTTNPTPKDIDTALNKLAINCVPIDIFSDTNANVLALTEEYASMTYHPKPVVLRNSA